MFDKDFSYFGQEHKSIIIIKISKYKIVALLDSHGLFNDDFL